MYHLNSSGCAYVNSFLYAQQCCETYGTYSGQLCDITLIKFPERAVGAAQAFYEARKYGCSTLLETYKPPRRSSSVDLNGQRDLPMHPQAFPNFWGSLIGFRIWGLGFLQEAIWPVDRLPLTAKLPTSIT